MTPRRTALLLVTPLLLVGATIAPGCSGSGSSNNASQGDRPMRAQGLTPLERSALREQSIALLEEEAFAEWALLRANAMEGLAMAPARADGVVRAGLADDNPGVRTIAAMLAGRLRVSGVVPSLEAMLEDPSPLVRIGAITALAQLGEEVDQTPLARLLEHERADVRAQAAYALGAIGNPSALPLLRSSVRGKAGQTPGSVGGIYRMQAAESMVKLGDRDAVNALRAALYPNSPDEAESAVVAIQILGEIGDRESSQQLVEIIEYKWNSGPRYLYPPEVRLAAATALVKMGFTPRGEIGRAFQEDESATVRAQVAFLYAEIGTSEFLARLSEMIDDQDPLVRVAAAAGVVKAMAPG